MPYTSPSDAGKAPAFTLPAVVWAALLLCGCSLPDAADSHADKRGSGGVSTAPGLPCSATDLPQQALVKINAYRAAGARCGLAGSHSSSNPLAWNEALTRAAALHSQDMALRGNLDHRGIDGSSLARRLDSQGYRWTAAAENVASGQPDLTQVLAAWMGSSSHCANLLAPAHRDVGLACRRAADGQLYWTAVFAQPLQAPGLAPVSQVQAPASPSVPPTLAPPTLSNPSPPVHQPDSAVRLGPY